jgi:predicted nucleic acid-binding protein
VKKPVVVPDASVVLKWVDRIPGEKDRERADALLDAWLDGRLEIVLPSLWAYEVGNVLGRYDPSRAGEFMEELLAYRFEEAHPTPDLCRAAFGLMNDHRVTFYDAFYHAVAVHHGGTFITADDAYYRKAHEKGKIALLRVWSPGS